MRVCSKSPFFSLFEFGNMKGRKTLGTMTQVRMRSMGPPYPSSSLQTSLLLVLWSSKFNCLASVSCSWRNYKAKAGSSSIFFFPFLHKEIC